MYEYQIHIHEEAGSFWSSCPDIPEAHSAGDSIEELLTNAVDGLRLALTIYVDQGRPIPQATPAQIEWLTPPVTLPVQVIAKIALWNAMCEQKMRVADLARKLGLSHPVASRLVDFEHNSKIEQVESALLALGKRLAVTVQAA